MKINHVRATAFIGARSIDVPIETPVAIFCGPNGAGKSSLAEAISAALTGDISRVALKKEYGAIVTEGKKKSEVVLSTDHGECCITLPDGKWQGLPIDMSALPYVLRPSLFAEKKDTERRTFLFGLTGVTLNSATVKQQLLDRECNEKKVESVLPMLRSGFPAACDFAKDKAKEAKGAWKGVTGETWGSEKGDGWEAEHANRALQLVERSLGRLDALVTSARDIEQATADAVYPERKLLNVSDFLKRLIAGHEVALSLQGKRLSAHIDDGITAYANEDLMETAIENLLDNAASYTKEGQTVEVRLARRDDLACITVADRGPGVDAEVIPRIFDRYVSNRPIPRDATMPVGSTGQHAGLGLWIVKRNIEGLGGTVAGRNREEGGFEVVVCLRNQV